MWRSVPLSCRLCSPVTPMSAPLTHTRPCHELKPCLICGEDTLKRWAWRNESAALQQRENVFTFAGSPALIRMQNINAAGLISITRLQKSRSILLTPCLKPHSCCGSGVFRTLHQRSPVSKILRWTVEDRQDSAQQFRSLTRSSLQRIWSISLQLTSPDFPDLLLRVASDIYIP